ncbi:MAG TPA: nidogen-like domain-containing protein, partial [Ktedonobacterales bacterium]|nr:nidogen-like domain-containing protein [Ktedonobacterales bacterium]
MFILCAAIVVVPGAAMTAHASPGGPGTAITTLPLPSGLDACLTNTLAANDDGSTAAVPLGFSLNFFGTQYTNVYVNNNGNITFTGPLRTYTPFGIGSAHTKIIAPFFADVYTIGSTPLTYSSPGATYQGHAAFCVDWVNVGYYRASDKLNSFQAILVDRSDIGSGDFDIIFNYNKVLWETGSASGGTGGLGGNPAHAGYSNGSNVSYEFPGSGTVGAFL